MAWQLLYTSAPRLLEAGRTGFGTVARHRGVGELVAGAVERVSQFARQAGLGARRVIHSHRIITAGATQVHVFSCIRDAGSDYTGRTNHLAHHLIADPREVRAAAEVGITPADILMQMKWRTSWSEPPRFLEPSEEITFTSLRARAFGSAWERLTGHSELSALPSQTTRCFVILPGETDALTLFQESLRTMGIQAAQITFTTHLEPTDDAADFRWVAMNASSPLRHQADGIARTVLDLTQPQSLPKLGATAVSAPARTSRESFTPLHVTAEPDAEMRHAPQSSMPGSFMESLHPLPRARSGRFAGIALAAILVVGLGIASYWWLDQQTQNSPARSAVDLAKRVDDLWQKHHLKLPATATWLKSQASVALTNSHEKSLRLLAQALREPLHPLEIPRPESTQDEFMEMLQSFSQWQQAVVESVHRDTWSRDAPAEIKIEARVQLDAEERLWKSFAKNLQRAPANTELLKQEISTQALKQLNKSAPPAGAAEDWRDVVSMTTHPAPQWLDLWVGISHLPAVPAPLQKSDQALLTAAAEDKKSPSWLQQQATKRLTQISVMNQSDTDALKAAEDMLKPTASQLQVQSADGPKSSHSRYIVIVTAEVDLSKALQTLPILPVQDDMQIIVGSAGFAEANLVRWRQIGSPGVYRKSFTGSATLEIKDGRLIKAPSDKDSWRIIGRSSTGADVLFEVLLIAQEKTPTEVWHADASFTFQNQHHNQRTVLDTAAASWLAKISFSGVQPHLRLQSVDDPARRFRVRLDAGTAVVEIETKQKKITATTARVSSLSTEIEGLKQGIRIDQQRKAEVAGGKLARREKEDSIIRFETGISNKELRILEMEEEMRGLTEPTASPVSLVGIPAGQYVLVAVVFSSDGSETALRLCELTITSQQAKNAP